MKLLAWKSGRVGSQWHILHFDQPLCGTPVLDRPIYTVTKAAKPSDWAHTCVRCQEIARRVATGPADTDGYGIVEPQGGADHRPSSTASFKSGSNGKDDTI